MDQKITKQKPSGQSEHQHLIPREALRRDAGSELSDTHKSLSERARNVATPYHLVGNEINVSGKPKLPTTNPLASIAKSIMGIGKGKGLTSDIGTGDIGIGKIRPIDNSDLVRLGEKLITPEIKMQRERDRISLLSDRQFRKEFPNVTEFLSRTDVPSWKKDAVRARSERLSLPVDDDDKEVDLAAQKRYASVIGSNSAPVAGAIIRRAEKSISSYEQNEIDKISSMSDEQFLQKYPNTRFLLDPKLSHAVKTTIRERYISLHPNTPALNLIKEA